MKKFTMTLVSLFLWICVLVCTPSDMDAAETSGTWGENVQWSFNADTNTLTISGTGAMEGDKYVYYKPWDGLYDVIYYIVIEDGITHICPRAFEGAIQLKEVTIPKSVTSIGQSAFERTGLTHIKLHDGITQIGINAFVNTRIEEVVIPAGVTEISDGLFRDNDYLKKVVLHDGVTTIRAHAFDDCTALESFVMPDSVTVLEDAFGNCIKLKEITLSKKIKDIPKYCFQGCTSLQEISIPDKVVRIWSFAFENCTSLEKVIIGSGLKEIDEAAFSGCVNMKNFVVSKKNGTFSNDEYGVLYSKDKKTLYFIPKDFTGDYTVPDGTQIIGRYAAYECEKLTGIILPNSLKEICRSAFDHCVSLKTVGFGNGVQSIETDAFAFCKKVEKLTIPASATYLGYSVFRNCEALRYIEFLGDRPLFDYGFYFTCDTECWYPAGNVTWENNLPQTSYDITWKPSCGNHVFVDVEGKSNSCTEEGYTEYVHCQNCGFKLVYPIISPAIGHIYGKWVYITPPDTLLTQHQVSRTCTRCGYEQIEFARNVDASELPKPPRRPTDETTVDTTIDTTESDTQTDTPFNFDVIFMIVIIIVAICLVGIVVYLVRLKKKE